MSGGSWDYFCYKMDEVSDRLIRGRDLRRKTFGKLMNLCAKAMKDIEWVDSDDCSPGDEYHAIDKCLKFDSKSELKAVVREELELLEKMIKELP
jgi:chaperonin cofactor prefoldin